jgi:hypothetical protein
MEILLALAAAVSYVESGLLTIALAAVVVALLTVHRRAGRWPGPPPSTPPSPSSPPSPAASTSHRPATGRRLSTLPRPTNQWRPAITVPGWSGSPPAWSGPSPGRSGP